MDDSDKSLLDKSGLCLISLMTLRKPSSQYGPSHTSHSASEPLYYVPRPKQIPWGGDGVLWVSMHLIMGLRKLEG